MDQQAVTMPSIDSMQGKIINIGKKPFDDIPLNFSPGSGVCENNDQCIEKIGNEINEGVFEVQAF